MPKTLSDLIIAGYTLQDSTVCKGCRRDIEFYRTRAGKLAPYDPMLTLDTAAVSHFATCPRPERIKHVTKEASQA